MKISIPVPIALALAITSWAVGGCSPSATSTEGRKAGAKRPRSAAEGAGKRAGSSTAAPTAEALPRLGGPHHAVFRLQDNRLLAHMLRGGGLVLPLGHPGAAKYLSFNRPWPTWQIDARADGQRVAIAKKSVSWLAVPLTARQAGSTVLSMRLKSARAQGVRIRLNGKDLEMVRLQPGWQTVQAAIPAGTLRAGENRVRLRWATFGPLAGVRRAYAAVHWLRIGDETPVAAKAGQALDISYQRGDDLWLPRGGGLAYYVFPYPDAKLRLRFSAAPTLQSCALITELEAFGQEPLRVERRVSGTGQRHGETFVDLGTAAQQVARLTLSAKGDGCAGITLQKASIVLPGAEPKLQREGRPKSVLFWLVDNARADRYRLYNPDSRVETPVIDRLGATGTVFENPYIVGTESRVSHAAIWTGMYPKQHRFVGPKARLDQRWVTLAEAIGQAGLRTAAWTANGNVSQFWGFGQGWDHFRNTLHKGGGLSAKALADHAIRFIGERGSKPFFLYVGTIDPHVSWRGRQPWLDRYYSKPYRGKYTKVVWGRDWDRLAGRPSSVSPTDRRRIRAIYDSTISYNDQQLGRVLEALEKKGEREQTMVVITADHGEELWEYGRIGHGGSLRDTVVGVPLLVNYPPLFGKGVRVREGVDVHAILATVLDALGAPVPDGVQAASLLPLAQGVGRGYPRPSFASQYELAYAIKLDRYKLWVGAKGLPRVFDLAAKEQERADIAAKRPAVTRWLTDAMGTFLHYQSRWRQARWGVASNHSAQLPADLEGGSAPAPIQPR